MTRCQSLYPGTGFACVQEKGHKGQHRNGRRKWVTPPVEPPDALVLLGLTRDEWLERRNTAQRELDEAVHLGDAESIESGLNDVSVCEYVLGLSFWKEQT